MRKWPLKNHQTLTCKILTIQLQNSVSHSVFNGFQQLWSLKSKLVYALLKTEKRLKIKLKTFIIFLIK